MKSDIFLVVILLIICLICVFAFRKSKNVGSAVAVEINGEVVGYYSLEKDGTYSLNKGTNVLLIEDGFARIIYADCPDKTCMEQGKIKYEGEALICLPNRLTVKVVKGEGGFDLVI